MSAIDDLFFNLNVGSTNLPEVRMAHSLFEAGKTSVDWLKTGKYAPVSSWQLISADV